MEELFQAFSQQRDQLPIELKARELLYKIDQNDVTIVVGETGCGKSTKLPEYLSKMFDQVCMTLPR